MKKILILSVFAVTAFVGCKKKETTISTLHSYSAPTILLPEGEYYSVAVGEVLPAVQATAYDSFYNEECTVVFDQSKLDNTIPGMYTVTATSKNQFGMAATRTIYVAVTDISPLTDLSGLYWHEATDDTVSISRLANGFYRTNDVAANGAGDTSHVVSAYFVQTSDIAIEIPVQSTKFGSLYGTDGVVTTSGPNTTLEYVIRNNAFAPIVRVFQKL